jgi:ribosome-associated protein
MSTRARKIQVIEDTPNSIVPISQEQREVSLNAAIEAAKCAAENKGQDIVVLDLSAQTSIFDFFVIVTGASRRQLHAIADDIDRVMKRFEYGRNSRSGDQDSRWIVLDYGGVVVHLFDEETRSYYDLENLWADSPQVDISDALKSTGALMSRDVI